MLKINDTLTGLNEIGDSVNSSTIEYGSLTKYEEIHKTKLAFSSIHFYYRPDDCLIAVKFWFHPKPPSTFPLDKIFETVPNILGPSTDLNSTDIIELNLEPTEEIYSIKGWFLENKIKKMTIHTTFGQYIDFGPHAVETNFQWDFYYNLRHFEGFLIGWDETSINYISSLVWINNDFNEDKNTDWKDITNDNSWLNIEPIYLTDSFGLDNSSVVDNDWEKFDVIQDIKEDKIFWSEISLYTEGKKITRIDCEYTEKETNVKKRNMHISKSFDEANQKLCLIMGSGDFVNEFSVSVSSKNQIQNVFFKTISGKMLSFTPSKNNEDNVYSFVEKEQKDKTLCWLGWIVGKDVTVQTLKFFYKSKLW